MTLILLLLDVICTLKMTVVQNKHDTAFNNLGHLSFKFIM